MSLRTLVRRLEGQLRPGAVDADALTLLMADAITHYPAGQEALVRRRALMALSSAMARHLIRALPAALLSGRFFRARELGRVARSLQEWTVELHFADEDPAADMIRIGILELQLGSSTLPEVRDLRAALPAMTRIGRAGSRTAT